MTLEEYRKERCEMAKTAIDKNAHYFTLMHPLEAFMIPGYGAIVMTSSDSREKWVECVVVEEKYKLEDGNKVELRSIEEGYGKEEFYIEDFISLEKQGYIVKKEPGLHCEEIEWEEPLGGSARVRHAAYVLTKKNKSEYYG